MAKVKQHKDIAIGVNIVDSFKKGSLFKIRETTKTHFGSTAVTSKNHTILYQGMLQSRELGQSKIKEPKCSFKFRIW